MVTLIILVSCWMTANIRAHVRTFTNKNTTNRTKKKKKNEKNMMENMLPLTHKLAIPNIIIIFINNHVARSVLKRLWSHKIKCSRKQPKQKQKKLKNTKHKYNNKNERCFS